MNLKQLALAAAAAVALLVLVMSPTVDRVAASPPAAIHPALAAELARSATPVKAWVFFADKGYPDRAALQSALAELEETYNPRALRRRSLRRTAPGLVDERDLPVSAAYLDAVTATGARLHVTSRWLNAASVYVTAEQAAAIARLPFVERLEPVRRGRRIEPTAPPAVVTAQQTRGWYGYAEGQLSQINLIALHNAGYTGQGVVVGILDTGFERSHEAFNYPGHAVNVLAEWDFVDNDPDTSQQGGDDPDQHVHGTLILGVLGAYYPNSFVGGAYDASFVLAKTEDITAEYPAEEDNYVAGLEFLEINGADMATSSLGYIDWYSQSDLDGLTAVTTIAVNTATDNGMYCTTAAGNSYHDSDPGTSHLIAPADAFKVITCGAVDSSGLVADFSSDGPTADGRVKPELLAQGVDTITVWPYEPTGYAYASGTSLSTPLVACAVACLIQAHPDWTVTDMRNHLFYTADYYLANGGYDPLFVEGYGILDAYAAHTLQFDDCNENGVEDSADIAGGTSQDCNGNGIPDECDIADGTSTDGNNNGIPDECECLGDLNSDGLVDLADLSIMLSHYGQAGGMAYADGDLDGDGDVDLADLSMLLAHYGQSC